jgi:hypothetical protein
VNSSINVSMTPSLKGPVLKVVHVTQRKNQPIFRPHQSNLACPAVAVRHPARICWRVPGQAYFANLFFPPVTSNVSPLVPKETSRSGPRKTYVLCLAYPSAIACAVFRSTFILIKRSVLCMRVWDLQSACAGGGDSYERGGVEGSE